MMDLTVIVLAAGKGKRMVSDLPKVLHRISGRPMLEYVLGTSRALGAGKSIVVYGHGGERVKVALPDRDDVLWVEQRELLGTGHAVVQALPQVGDGSVVLILYGDVPLVRCETLRPLIASARGGSLGLLTVELADPWGYGRIIRDSAGQVRQIVEERDADVAQRQIREINTGIIAAPVKYLREWVNRLDNDNTQGEYYLTDVIAMAVNEGVPVKAFSTQDPSEVQGVNDRRQLAHLERYYQRRQADALLLQGATLLDPARVDIRGSLTVGRDVVIDVNVIFEGEVVLGDRVRIGPHCVLRDVVVGDDSAVEAYSHIEGAELGQHVQIGPYGRLRPGVVVANNARVGNFVEVKKSVIGEASKVNHLTYIGDTEIGCDVNVGAGTITCNYDGANKHKTVIGDRAFIGSNAALVAPVRIGAGATVGAGSTIAKDVPDDALALTRASQNVRENWQRPLKKKT